VGVRFSLPFLIPPVRRGGTKRKRIQPCVCVCVCRHVVV
jgi:hypothetical protein